MENFFSFKRFVTFGLGLGMFMSAATGFAQTMIPSNIVRATNGPLLLQGTDSIGVATQSVSISNVGHIDARSANFNGADGVSAVKLTMSNGGTISGSNQVVTIDAVGNGNIKMMDSVQVQGNVTATGTISSSQAVQTTGTGSISSAYNLSAAGNKFNVAGDTGNVTTTGSVTSNTANIGNSTTANSVALNVTGAAVVSQNLYTKGLNWAQGGLRVDGTTPSGNAMVVNGKTAMLGELSMGGNKITGVAAGTATTDAVNVGQLNAAVGDLSGQEAHVTVDGTSTGTIADTVSTGLAGQSVTLQLKSVVGTTAAAINRTNVRVTALEVGLAENAAATAQVQTNLDTEVTRLDARIDTTNTNVSNLTTTVETNRVTAAAATDQVQTNLNATNVRVTTVEGKVVDLRTDLTNETQARIDGDSATLNSANNYTNQQVQAQSGADRAYTDKQVGTERDRAMAAEAAISKEVRQVGAMAMAASAVGSATPVGDKTTAVSVAVGGYSGETAVAVGVTHMVKPNARIFGSISAVSRGKTGVAVGASFSF